VDLFHGIDLNEYHTVRFDGSFKMDSPFKGPPSPSVDEAWNRNIIFGPMALSPSEFHKLNASKYSVRLSPEKGGGYLAVPEFAHQLHCVKMLWEHTYPEYYQEAYNETLQNPEFWHIHADHCADLLRQKLMCDADEGLISFNWMKNHTLAHPNFNTQHRCRDYQAVYTWARSREMREGEITVEDLIKPKGKGKDGEGEGEGEGIKQFDLFDPPKDPDADH